MNDAVDRILKEEAAKGLPERCLRLAQQAGLKVEHIDVGYFRCHWADGVPVGSDGAIIGALQNSYFDPEIKVRTTWRVV